MYWKKIKWSKKVVSLISVSALCLVFVVGCSQNNAKDGESQVPLVSKACPVEKQVAVSTINQWGSLLESIAGQCLDIQNVINDTTVEPHSFEVNTNQASYFQNAKLTVLNGAGYDSWADKLIAPASKVINVAEKNGITEKDNPHIWFSVTAIKKTAESMKTELINMFNNKSATEYFEENYSSFQKDHSALINKINKYKSEHRDQTALSTESVIYYLQEELGIEDLTPDSYINIVKNEGEITPGVLSEFIAKEKDAKMLFYNTQEENEQTEKIKESASSDGLKIVDVTEQKPKDVKTLLEWINQLVDKIAN
jgi:zinc/manganese transport system substrate-binding protein